MVLQKALHLTDSVHLRKSGIPQNDINAVVIVMTILYINKYF